MVTTLARTLRRSGRGLLALPLLAMLLAAAAPAAAPEPYLVKDIAWGVANSYPAGVGALDGAVFFRVRDDVRLGLWKSDGSADGTVLVRGGISPHQSWTNQDATVGDALFFPASDYVSGTELWITDGTELGTALVKDIYPGKSSSSPTWLTELNGILYFVADDGTHGQELWRSDGTASGTQLVVDVRPGSVGSKPQLGAELDGDLYFAADDGVHGKQLWKTDGTEPGTSMVTSLSTEQRCSITAPPVKMKGMLYFAGHGGLCQSDGTAGGTDLHRAAFGTVRYLTVAGQYLYWRADEVEIWRTDGTVSGRVLLRTMDYDEGAFPYGFTAVNDTLFFASWDDLYGIELWKSDGTPAGTQMLKDINPRGNACPWEDGCALIAVGGKLLFTARDDTHGVELWTSDGTENGTTMVKDIHSGGSSAFNLEDSPAFLAATNRGLFFAADDGTHGNELWVYDAGACTPPCLPSPSSPPNESSTYETRPTFTWSSSAGATEYRIRVVEAESGTEMFNEKTTRTEHRPDVPLPPGTYYWRVRAFNDCGESEWTLRWSLTVLSSGLSAPTLVWPSSGTAICELAPTFVWSAVGDATWYRIQVDRDGSFSAPVIDQGTQRPTYRPDAPLSPTTYHWRVQAANGSDDSDWSSTGTFALSHCLYAPLILKGN